MLGTHGGALMRLSSPFANGDARDFLLAARLLVKECGDDAGEYAARMIWKLRQEKNEEAVSAWYSILLGIKELRNMFPPEYLH